MTRLLTIAVLLTANVVATEAQRGQSSPRSATAGAVHSSRPNGSRVAPTVNRPIPGTLHLPFHGAGRRIGIATLPIFWGWGVPLFYVDSGAPTVPLPDDGPTGGVQLDVTPWRSRVYVDGVLKGRVDDFNGYYHPLELVAGPHQITIVDEGYQPTVVDILVTPGRTTTYRATLNAAAGR
jgi:PEGA domain-containing protein